MTLLRNAAILDQQSATEKLKALNEELLTPEEALLSKTKERLRLLKEASPASAEYREVMKKISRAAVENAPEYSVSRRKLAVRPVSCSGLLMQKRR